MNAALPDSSPADASPPRQAGAKAMWTLIYDGDCGFCARCVRLVRRWDRRGAVRIAPYQDARALAGLPPIPRASLERAMHLLSPRGEVFAGAAALPPLLRLLPGGAALALLLKLPGAAALAPLVYRSVARNRHRLPGATARCEVEDQAATMERRY